jgi:phosphonate transport system permease protein
MSKPNTILAVVAIILTLTTVYAFVSMDYGKVSLFDALLKTLRYFCTMIFEPRLSGHFSFGVLVEGLFITIAIAVLATLGGSVIAFVLGLFAAVNLSTHIVSNAIKMVMAAARAVPTIIWILVFSVAIGLGPEAAVVGMLFHGVAYLVKAYSESFEEVDAGVLEALRATGATWWQMIAHGVIREKLNEILSWTFLRFEINFATAVAVACIAGSGGIGYELYLAGYFYVDPHEIGLIVYLCFTVSAVLEVLATNLRKRCIVNR